MALVDVNTADLEQLTSLPGITDSIARAIIENVRMYGPYFDLDELAGDSGPPTAAQVDAIRDRAEAVVPN